MKNSDDIESFFRRADTSWWNPNCGCDNRFWFFRAQLEYIENKLQRYIDTPKNILALDAGCGRGIHSLLLQNLGCNVISLDINPAMLALTNQIIDSSLLVEGSLMDIPFLDESLDVIVSVGTSMHVPSITKMISEIYRILNEKGIAVVSIANRFSLYILWTTKINKNLVQHQQLYHRNQFTFWKFKGILLRQGFRILDSKGFAIFPPISLHENWKNNIINPQMSRILSYPFDWLFGRYFGCGVTFIVQKN